ncbi:hypothetical protein AeMF1_017988 [Aphanomyces euteiches]|nr:hypothetical protein AeMF1_017988 [Aphanomyces euteiches]
MAESIEHLKSARCLRRWSFVCCFALDKLDISVLSPSTQTVLRHAVASTQGQLPALSCPCAGCKKARRRSDSPRRVTVVALRFRFHETAASSFVVTLWLDMDAAAAANVFAAARSNDLVTIQQLVESLTTSIAGFDINRLVDDHLHNTLMHIACSNGNLPACKYLFMHGMYLNEPNKLGHTPLFYAADCGNLPLVKWMVSNGADIDTDYSSKATIESDNDRRYDVAFTPLQVACVKGHVDVVDFLVECNADLGGSTINGVTPLHFACHQSQRAVAKILLEAGADLHASDRTGVSPMDLASGPMQSFLTAYDEHGTFDDDTSAAPALADQSPIDGPDVTRLLPDCIGRAFGAHVARQLASSEWKQRQQGVVDTALAMQQGGSTAAKHFDAACHVLVVAANDSVNQVFSAAMPLLKSAFNAAMASPSFHTQAFHASHPLVDDLLALLLGRAAGAHERDASDAVTAVLFLACKSVHATQRIVAIIRDQLRQSSSGGGGSGGGGWRQQLVYLRLLTAIASQYRFASESNFSMDDATQVTAQALEHANAKVRTAAVDLFVQSILITSEASGLDGTPDDMADHVCNFADSILAKYMGVVKPALVATIHSGLKAAVGNSRRLSDGGGGRMTPGKPHKAAAKLKQLLVEPKDDNLSDADLPYAEPVVSALADGVTACFGEKVARCLFSNAWAPRVEGLSFLQKRLEARSTVHLSIDVVHALEIVLQAALSDRVNAVYEGGIALLMEFVLAYGASSTASAKQLQDTLRPLIPRLVLKLGDTKPRLQLVSEDALLFLSRQPLAGPVFVVDAMPSLTAPSTALLANKLDLLVKLLLEFGVQEATGGGAIALKHLVHPAIQACQHKDGAVRHAAIQLVAEALKVARPATMPFLDGLARGARQKLISKLVELGVLETDLLMDEVDDFAVDAQQQRPATGGARPPTASGSSTKHRPALTSVSVLAPPPSSSPSTALSSGGELPYGTALTDDQRSEYSRTIAVLGEPIVRCLLDKTWAPREAAVREMEKKVLEAIRGGGGGVLPHDAATLVVLSQALELVLHDTVARVYQCALRLLQVVATEFVPGVAGHELVLHSTLRPAIEAVIQKLGDSKQRLRSDSFAVLHALAMLPHIGANVIATCVLDQIDRLDGAAPVAIPEMLMLLTSLLRTSVGSQEKQLQALNLQDICNAIVPALENKHVDIRNAAVAAYTALYQAVKAHEAADVDMQTCLATLKPAVREAITKNILQLQKQQARPLSPTPSATDSAPEVDSARSTHDMAKVGAIFGSEVVALLTSSVAFKRRQGVVDMTTTLKANLAKSNVEKSTWEVCCLLAKTLLLDAQVSVVLAVLELLEAVATAIPWGEWGVHLILGSTIRSVLQQAAHPALRVRLAVKLVLQVMASRHHLGRTVVATATLSVPDDRKQAAAGQSAGNATAKTMSTRWKRLERLRMTWHYVLRLEMVDEMLQEHPATDLLCLDNVVSLLGQAIDTTAGSPTVVVATKTVLAWFHTQDATNVVKAIQGLAPRQRQALSRLLGDNQDDSELSNQQQQGGNPAAGVVVRTSRASHIRRVAALRPTRQAEDDDDDGDNAPCINQAEKPQSVPLWLRDESTDDHYNGGGGSTDMTGGALGLVKARRKSHHIPTNNNEEDNEELQQHRSRSRRSVHVSYAGV